MYVFPYHCAKVGKRFLNAVKCSQLMSVRKLNKFLSKFLYWKRREIKIALAGFSMHSKNDSYSICFLFLYLWWSCFSSRKECNFLSNYYDK